MIALRRDAPPAIIAVALAAAGFTVANTSVQIPTTSAIASIWADLVRDADTVGLAITRVSPGEERRIGDVMAAGIETSWQVQSGVLPGYVASVGKMIVDAAGPRPFPYSFRVLSSPNVNAFAVAGGHIYVTSGLLGTIHSEAELAAILGHEVSHVALHHCIGRLQYELAVRRIAGSDIGAIVGLAHNLIAATYGSEQETDADLNGMLLAAKAGYDPRATVSALGILLQIESPGYSPSPQTAIEEVAGGIAGLFTQLKRDHPQATQRIADVEAWMS